MELDFIITFLIHNILYKHSYQKFLFVFPQLILYNILNFSFNQTDTIDSPPPVLTKTYFTIKVHYNTPL